MEPTDGLTPAVVSKIVDRGFVARAVTGSGEDAGGAGYGLSDISGGREFDAMANGTALAKWANNPALHAELWKTRLWNTCGLILRFGSAGRVLIYGDRLPAGERYLFDVPNVKRGDGRTFAKTNKIAAGENALAEVRYDAVPKDQLNTGAVQALYNQIMAAITKL